MSLDPVKCPARSLCFFGPDTAHMFGPDTAHMFGPDTAHMFGPDTAHMFGPDTAHMFGPDTAHMFGHCDVNFWIIDLICFSCCRACAICQSGRLET